MTHKTMNSLSLFFSAITLLLWGVMLMDRAPLAGFIAIMLSIGAAGTMVISLSLPD